MKRRLDEEPTEAMKKEKKEKNLILILVDIHLLILV
jgi:hypothetical protein